MNISPGEKIAGFPAVKLRELFREISDGTFGKKYTAAFFGITQKKAVEVLQELEKLGYLESVTRTTHKKPEIRWQLTTKGFGLRMASAARPIKRATADRLLKELLERVEEINKSKAYLYKVTEVVVFGSYLDESRTKLSDLDVSVDIRRKEPNIKKHVEMCNEQSDREVKGYISFLDEFYYSFFKVVKRLKNRSWGLSLHINESIIKSGIPTKKVFPAEKKRLDAAH